MIPRLGTRRGSILIGIVYTLVMVTLMAVTGVSMFVNQTFASVNLLRRAEAQSARLGAIDYAMKLLQNDADGDWSNFPTPLTVTLGGITSTVTRPAPPFGAPMKNSIQFAVSTQSADQAGPGSFRAFDRFNLIRTPKAFQFALFRGEPNAEGGGPETLAINNSTLREASIYSNGSLDLNASFILTGQVYHSAGSSLSGVSGHTVDNPQPAMPRYDLNTASNGYEAKIAVYETDITNAQDAPGPVTITGDINNPYMLGGGTLEATDVFISPVSRIWGQGGKIVAKNNIYFMAPTRSTCEQETEDFKSSNGGCKRLQGAGAGVVWGAEMFTSPGPADDLNNMSCNTMTDHGWTPAGSWRLPTVNELQDLAAAPADSHLAFDINRFFWASDGSTVNISTGEQLPPDPENGNPFVCVRTAPPEENQGGPIRLGPKLTLIAGNNIVITDDRVSVMTEVPESNDGSYWVTLYAKNDIIINRGYSNGGAGHFGFYAEFLAGRRIVITPGTMISRACWGPDDYCNMAFPVSVYYVRRNPDPTNNYIEIRGPNTFVEGTFVSVSERNPNLIVDDAQVDGMVFSKGTDTGGRLLIQDSTVNGSVIASRFQGNVINNVDITGKASTFRIVCPGGNMDQPPCSYQIPDGFTGTVSKVPNSWRGD